MMRFKFRVNRGVWFTPKVEFSSEWAAWLYIKSLFGDLEIFDFKVTPVKPAILTEQAS